MASRVAARWLVRLAYEFSLDEAYKFMGLSPGASPDDIKTAYRNLTLKYHPDRGGDPEDMKRLNAAREVIESGGTVRRPLSPESTVREETIWERYRARYGPQASGTYVDTDLQKLAQDVLDKNLRQIVTRGKVPWVPVDAGVPQGGRWTYHRPFGSKIRTQRLPDDVDADKLYQAIRSFGKGSIFDVVVKNKEAWVTWEHPDGKFQSLSFEEVKAKPKKPPGVGMKPEDAAQRMRAGGLDVVAGGSKYGYWGVRGQREKTGYFIREAAKTLRVVHRVKTGDYRGIQDHPLAGEIYFGKLTPETLDKWIEFVKRKAG
jgi:curved DNA-binding protein CbpA